MEQARAKTSDARCSGDTRCCVVTLQEIRKCPHALKRRVLDLRNIFFLFGIGNFCVALPRTLLHCYEVTFGSC